MSKASAYLTFVVRAYMCNFTHFQYQFVRMFGSLASVYFELH